MAKHKASGPWLSGDFKPLNPEKYRGNINDIIFRSSYELAAFKFCDSEPAIIMWNSEEEIIPYMNPRTGRQSRYMMDLKIWTADPETGELKITLVEIKPLTQTRPPRKGNKKDETYMRECATWAVNSAKWEATERYCAERGWAFVKWTEEELVPGIKHDKEIQKKMVARRKEKRELKKKQSIRNDKVKRVGRLLAEQIRARAN